MRPGTCTCDLQPFVEGILVGWLVGLVGLAGWAGWLVWLVGGWWLVAGGRTNKGFERLLVNSFVNHLVRTADCVEC
jgi:hypothetical protein